MAGKKLPKDVDFAAGFFSKSASADETVEAVTEKITAPAPTTEKPTAKNDFILYL